MYDPDIIIPTHNEKVLQRFILHLHFVQDKEATMDILETVRDTDLIKWENSCEFIGRSKEKA